MAENQPTIAVIEDNTDLREELTFFLQHRGYSAWGAPSAEHFWKKLHSSPADIVLVDLGLPGEDGYSVVDYLRNLGKFGLIIITARGHHRDKLQGLNLGADFYMVKPVNFSELASSINALWSRMVQDREAQSNSGHREQADAPRGQWQLFNAEQCLETPGGARLRLTSQEHHMISILGRSQNEVFAKEALAQHMFQYSDPSDTHRIDVILSRLRKKAKQKGIDLPVRSIFGKGLVFVGEVKTASEK